MRQVSKVALALLGVLFGLLLTEFTLRLAGEGPGSPPVTYDPRKFRFKAPWAENKLTGWQLKPGEYLIQTQDSRKIRISVDPDSSRRTRPSSLRLPKTSLKVLFLGDSFTFGEGLNDEETLPWVVQDLHPQLNVRNHAVGGFGTCQTMLRLEQLTHSLRSGDTAIYGFSSFHELRNTADPRIDYWIALSSPLRRSFYPQCRLVDGHILIEQPRRWDPILPLAGYSSISKLLTELWLSTLASEASKMQRSLTEAIIKRMKDRLALQGVSLVVLVQEIPSDALAHYQSYFLNSDTPSIDGSLVANRAEMKLLDGHPGPEMTKIWAHQVREYLNHSKH